MGITLISQKYSFLPQPFLVQPHVHFKEMRAQWDSFTWWQRWHSCLEIGASAASAAAKWDCPTDLCFQEAHIGPD